MKLYTGSQSGFAIRPEDALPPPKQFRIYYYDVLKETVEMRDREAAIRWMGWRYGGMVGMRVVAA